MDFAPSKKFSFNATKWLSWKRRFKCFRVAARKRVATRKRIATWKRDLCSNTGERHVAILIYAMDKKTEGIFALFKLGADGSKKYDIVLQKLEDHFIAKKNKKYKRSNFDKWIQ